MCGRYSFEASKKELSERYQLKESADEYKEKEEIYPTNISPIVLPEAKIGFLTWGFSPSFTKRPLINARGETILEKQTFSQAFKTKRCLVPATSFFEWEKLDNRKEKREISVKNQTIFSMAGIYDSFLDKNGKEVWMYSIITTEANEQLKGIHDRMPVILTLENEDDYLDLDQPPEKIQELLKPFEQELIVV
ncbi:SOS response-associated peptidase [Desemzia sp. RIT804]|uniref:SOS response-associated peptidase n=1 Tax=Desemzia sp. RIT 804 TaxID=2810209 RepID=UPI00194F29BE|nr:SOS response-associated peptidase [Desemzia sp. RIT 804]